MAAVTTAREGRPLRIGAVCRRLQDEFPDISISKIRYLEDQGLLAPSRTQGGYRLYSEADVERLRVILRLQRDEFLPLRVIREELAVKTGRTRRDRRRPEQKEGLRARLDAHLIERDELLERAEADPALVDGLVDAGILHPDGDGRFPESDAAVAQACGRLLREGIPLKKLTFFRRGADNVVDVLVTANPDLYGDGPRHETAVDRVERLSAQALDLYQSLFWQELRARIGGS